MRSLKALYERLAIEKNFHARYTEYKPGDRKVHVLFLSPCMNEAGYYRMILPALELNRTDTHAAIVTNIQKWDFNKLFDDYDNPIDFRLLQWADYVVLPPMFTDVQYIVHSFRQVNSELQFAMDIDLNYHELPDYHPDYKKIKPESMVQLINNLNKIDILSAPNSLITKFYYQLLQKSEEAFSIDFQKYPNLLSHFTFQEIPQIILNNSAKVRIGIIADPSQASDLKTVEDALTSLLETHKDAIEIIIFGWTAKVAEHFKMFQKRRITYEKPVPFYEHHARLNSLAFDIGLLPLVDNTFNISSKAFNRFLDYSGSRIPIIAPNLPQVNQLIEDGENGYVAASQEEWIAKTSRLITDAALRKAMGQAAFSMAWENYSYTPLAIQRLKSIFI